MTLPTAWRFCWNPWGHSPAPFTTVLTGLAALQEFKQDIVFIDIAMPGVDGYETARRIRNSDHAHQVTLVALTGWGRDEDRRRAQQAGFDLYLMKPASIDTIKALLRRAR